jgi:hypothetical protein
LLACLLACLLDDDGEISVLKLVATSNIASQESNCKFHQPLGCPKWTPF